MQQVSGSQAILVIFPFRDSSLETPFSIPFGTLSTGVQSEPILMQLTHHGVLLGCGKC